MEMEKKKIGGGNMSTTMHRTGKKSTVKREDMYKFIRFITGEDISDEKLDDLWISHTTSV